MKRCKRQSRGCLKTLGPLASGFPHHGVREGGSGGGRSREERAEEGMTVREAGRREEGGMTEHGTTRY